jgi:hypothetical protein
MERYNKNRSDGKKTVAQFCSCGHAAVIVSNDLAEHDKFKKDWQQWHGGAGHELIDFDTWVTIALRTPAVST